MNTFTNPRNTLTTAWAGMLAVLLAMLLIDPLQHAMAGQYEALTHTLQHDPGTLGLRVLIGMLCANSLMQVGIQMFGGPAWRSFVLVITALYGLFFPDPPSGACGGRRSTGSAHRAGCDAPPAGRLCRGGCPPMAEGVSLTPCPK